MSKLMTVKEYAKAEGVTTSAIYNRIRRFKVNSFVKHGIILIVIDSDMTIKKPRKNGRK